MAASSLTEDLIAWWSMDDDPDTGFQSDEKERLKLTGINLTQVSGRVDRSVEFAADGTSRLYTQSNGLIQLENRPFTFAVWVKFNSFGGSPVIFSKTDSSPINAQYRLEYNDPVTSIAFRVGNASLSNVVLAFNGAGPPLNVWHLVVAWLDGKTGYLHIRFNDSDYENVSTNPMVTGKMLVNTENFYVGSNPDGSNPLDGAVDNLALWGRVLTRAEQAALWNGGSGVPYCALLDRYCKSVVCCDLPSFDYNSSSSSDADGQRTPTPIVIVPPTPPTPPVPPVPPVDDPCGEAGTLEYTNADETGDIFVNDGRWYGIAYIDSADLVAADSEDDTGIALLDFSGTPALSTVLPIAGDFRLFGIHYNVSQDRILAFIRYDQAPNFSYRLAFLDPITGFIDELDVGLTGISNVYTALFCPISSTIVGVHFQCGTFTQPDMFATINVETRSLIASAFYEGNGGAGVTREFSGICYSCDLDKLVTTGRVFAVDPLGYYVWTLDPSTLAIVDEYFVNAVGGPIFGLFNPTYLNSTGKVFAWSGTGYYDIDPATGTVTLIEAIGLTQVVPLYYWNIDRVIAVNASNNVLLYNPTGYTKDTIGLTNDANSWNYACARNGSVFYVHDEAPLWNVHELEVT